MPERVAEAVVWPTCPAPPCQSSWEGRPDAPPQSPPRAPPERPRTSTGHPAPAVPRLTVRRDIHAVSVVDAPQVQQDQISRAEQPVARPGVRKRGVRSGRDDGVERRAVETRPLHQPIHDGGNLPLTSARTQFPGDLTDNLRQQRARRPQYLELVVVLAQPRPLDDPLRRDQPDWCRASSSCRLTGASNRGTPPARIAGLRTCAPPRSRRPRRATNGPAQPACCRRIRSTRTRTASGHADGDVRLASNAVT